MSELINIHQAKTQLSKLLSRVASGEEFTIANRGVPVAKLVPCTPPETKGDRIPGRLAGQIQMSDDFNEPDEEMIDLFYREIIAQPTDKEEVNFDINHLVNKVREQVKADIETRCGTMRILDMSHPVGLNDIYTKVNILEKISGRTRKNIGELISNCDLENFDRFNFGQVKEKIPGNDAVRKYRTLLILGKPGAGKTTFLKHLVIQCSRGLFQEDLVPFFVTLKDFAEADKQPKLLSYLNFHQLLLEDPPKSSVKRGSGLDVFKQILEQGKALICLDGLDEVLAEDSKRVIKEIENLVHNYPNNQYLMTCRIAAREYTFEKFNEVEIADFDWEQITTFATNWFQNKPVEPDIS